MSLPIDHLPYRVPRRLPIGTTYVVEGYGGGQGNLRVIARYLLMPDGHRINVPYSLSRPASPRTLAFRHNPHSKRSQAEGRSAGVGKKLAGRRGTR
jgi:hypothetical protein